MPRKPLATQTAELNERFESCAPAAEFVVTDAGPSDIQPESMITLTGVAWIHVRQIQFADSDLPLDVRWTDVTTWEIDVPGVTELIVEADDFDGDGDLTSEDLVIAFQFGHFQV